MIVFIFTIPLMLTTLLGSRIIYINFGNNLMLAPFMGILYLYGDICSDYRISDMETSGTLVK